MLAALLAVVVASSEVVGKLCVADQPCVVSALANAAVTPAAIPRTFSWSAADGRSIAFGVVAVDATSIAKAPPATLRLRLTSAIACELTLRAKPSLEWRTPLNIEQAKSGVDVHVDPGEYEVVVEAPHYRRAKQVKIVKGDPVVALVPLEPLPQISGRVITRKDSHPVAGAAIAAAERVVALSAGDGRFTFEADPEQWPASLTISAGGFGTAVLPLPRARAATDLLDVALSVAATVEVKAEWPGSAPVDIAIYRLDGGSTDEHAQATKTIQDQAEIARFESLAPGQYVVSVSGKGVAERFGKKIEMEAGERKTIALVTTPLRVTIRTDRGGKALPDALVTMWNRDGLWRGEKFHTGADGSIQLLFWQTGVVSALVSSEALPRAAYLAVHDVTGDSDIEWTITMPTRIVRVQIVDAVTGKPIPHAFLAMQQGANGEDGITLPTTTDDEGRFSYESATAGFYEFNASADAYRRKTIRQVLAENEDVHELTIPLDPAPSARVTVRDDRGNPIPGALVLEFTGLHQTGQRMTDASGEVRVPIEDGATRELYALPRDGSIATATLRTREDMALVVPPPQTTLVINCVDTKDRPVANMWLVMRINGIPLPVEVMEALASFQGAKVSSGADGRIVLGQMPLGVHEFWPVESVAHVRSALTGLGKKAPVTIVAHGGINEATLTFAENETTKP